MKLQIIPPSPLLADIVKHYWLMEYQYPEHTIHSQRIIPTGLPELTFFLEERITSDNSNRDFDSCAIISGQQNRFYNIRAKGHLRMITVTFMPHGLSLLTRIPLNELFNQSVDAKLILGHEIILLCEQLHEITNPLKQTFLIESYFTKYINKLNTNYSHPRINKALKLITPVNLSTSIEQLAEQACWSRKHFERVFAQVVGCSPKQFINTIRFQYALHLKGTHPNYSLLDIAFASGYYDQPHMCNDFIKQSGLSPQQYFNICAPQSDYFDF